MLLAKGNDLVGASWTTPRPRSPEQTDRPRNWGDGGDGESPSRTGDAKDAGKVIGRAGQNGRQAKAQLALEIRREIEARHEEADRLRRRMIERAQIEADLAQRRFMLVDPNNRLVADTLEREWNDKLRALAEARQERERARQQDQVVLDDAIRQRLAAMTTDFRRLW